MANAIWPQAYALAATPVGVKLNAHVLLASSSISLPELASNAGLLEAPPAEKSSERRRKVTEQLGQILRRSKQLALQTQQMTAKHEELALQTQQMTAEHERLAMQTQQMTAEHERLAMQTQQMTKELALQTQQMTTTQKKVALQIQQMTLDKKELALQTQQMMTKYKELEDEITKHKVYMFYPLCIEQLYEQAEERINIMNGNKHGAGVLTVEQEALVTYAKQYIKATGVDLREEDVTMIYMTTPNTASHKVRLSDQAAAVRAESNEQRREHLARLFQFVHGVEVSDA
eukprot:CAMPEP_0202889742 /NCGR_PEP_ID=MMETSP1392-20130828/326_1 /ASSEMBLY_ACC=CAM_ASM_000868 /TAXON_ID=225041 /ORGANISM="Chlamydomonas chlamydogama, Strain SAG 11-48b" /LENGTH=287 /DNA_ID=CAMNT_0049573143 /DNA_START=99 /DNA_END=962 /DNA_ORIENTATION=+